LPGLVALLLDAGVPPDALEDHGETPLLWAAFSGSSTK
jgi:ankyrin repeat protein